MFSKLKQLFCLEHDLNFLSHDTIESKEIMYAACSKCCKLFFDKNLIADILKKREEYYKNSPKTSSYIEIYSYRNNFSYPFKKYLWRKNISNKDYYYLPEANKQYNEKLFQKIKEKVYNNPPLHKWYNA